MDRRKFLSTLIGGVAAAAAVRTFPFRVFSFPKEIKLANWYSSEIFYSEIFYFNTKTGFLTQPTGATVLVNSASRPEVVKRPTLPSTSVSARNSLKV